MDDDTGGVGQVEGRERVEFETAPTLCWFRVRPSRGGGDRLDCSASPLRESTRSEMDDEVKRARRVGSRVARSGLRAAAPLHSTTRLPGTRRAYRESRGIRRSGTREGCRPEAQT